MLVLVFLLVTAISIQSSEIPTFKCHVYYDDDTKCQLENLQLSKDQPYFNIDIKNPEKIQEVALVDSNVPVLSSSICEKFPALMHLHAEGSSITTINEDAFERCTNIRTIDLRNNKIRALHENTFQNNLELKELMLETNRLKRISERTFASLADLEFLSLPDNNLTEFSPTLLRNNQKLSFIYLFTNNLSNLDLETLHEINPNLGSIYINRNEFSCVRIQEMLDFANENMIQFSRKSFGERLRYYEVEEYEGFTCLGDVAWAANHYRKVVEERAHV